jgi:FixJ family two-component response regulator
MSEVNPIVYLVDDDQPVLKALSRLLSTKGYDVRCFSSPRAFLEQHDTAAVGCAIVDLAMPELDGLQVQSALADAAVLRPVIFLTGRGDVPSSVRAMKAGAVDFLTKPVDAKDLLPAVALAVEKDEQARRARGEIGVIRAKFARLTPREHEVLTYVVAGRLNKQIANDLGTVEKTIKVHRSRMMEKLGVRTVADLVRLADKAGVAPHQQSRG